MSKPFQTMIQKIATARCEPELLSRFMDAAGEVFGAQHWSIALRDENGALSQINLKGLPDSFIDYYTQYGIEIDPLRAYVLEYHAPVHEQILFTEESWKRSDLYVDGCGKQYDHEHAMTGAIVGAGKLMGLINFSRPGGTPAFNAQDLTHISAVSAHLSATLAMLKIQSPYPLPQLTQREQQIAELVARGLTNAAIGSELWITQNTVKQSLKRIFRKLDISARTELVAKISRLEITGSL
jgi:DNA-binding CsgD family transcriptional regulator